MKEKLRFGFSIFWVLVGVVLFGLSVAEVIDSYWGGMGGGLIGVGILQTIRHIRYRKDPEYREIGRVTQRITTSETASSAARPGPGRGICLCSSRRCLSSCSS